MGKKSEKKPEKKPSPKDQALQRIEGGPLFKVADYAAIICNDKYPMAKGDWLYLASSGDLYLNPRKEGTVGEWKYVISHSLLHLAFGHCVKEKINDPFWIAACDYVVTNFLRDSHIGTPPHEFQRELPFIVKSENQAYYWLKEHSTEDDLHAFGTMSNARPDMVWDEHEPGYNYTELFAESLQLSMRDAIRESKGLEPLRRWYNHTPQYMEAREWFISSYPLLGAIAASFKVIDDEAVVQRMDIPVAAISSQLQEIYINPRCRLSLEEWKFVFAHEFLHAALRHDLRCEDRDPELWNVACDFVVNCWLVEMDVGVMPDFVLYDTNFKGMSVEGIYDVICEDIRQYRKQNPGDMIYGDPSWWNNLDGAKQDEFYRSALQQGLNYHQERGRGLLPANLVEEIHAISQPPIRWDVELARWFDENFSPLEKRRTFSRMSRRQSSSPAIPRPAWYQAEEPLEQHIFGVLLDTSGSMDRSLLAAALGSIASYSEARDVNHVRVVFCDAAAYDQGIMSPDDIAGSVKVRGRGGTKLQPGIDLLDADPKFPKNAPLLIITDGACDRLNLRGRKHAYLIPYGYRPPFPPKGPVFKLK